MKYVTNVLAGTLVAGCLLGISVNGFSQDSKTNQPADQNLKDQSKKNEAPHRPPSRCTLRPSEGLLAGASVTVLAAPSVKFLSSLCWRRITVGSLPVNSPPSTGLFPNSTLLPVELTVMDPQEFSPSWRLAFLLPSRPVCTVIRLSDYNVRLASGAAYRWFVSVVPDADRRSKDITAGGAIERVEMPEGLQAKVAQAAKSDFPRSTGKQASGMTP